jgi:hypothetical protein
LAPKSYFWSILFTWVCHAGRSAAVVFSAARPLPSKKPKAPPVNWLPPDLVRTFSEPPVMRPYSAGMPPVLTSTSSMKSKLSDFVWSP